MIKEKKLGFLNYLIIGIIITGFLIGVTGCKRGEIVKTIIVKERVIVRHCIICNKDITNDSNKISPSKNDLYYCLPCYERQLKMCRDIQSQAQDKADNSSGNENQNESDYSTGSDGRIYENAACSLCGGTGIEMGTAPNPVTGKWEPRVCPQCGGRGHESY